MKQEVWIGIALRLLAVQLVRQKSAIVGRSGLIGNKSRRSNWPWLESAVTPSDCLFLLHYPAPGCARDAPASVFYPPPLNGGQEPKTGFEDYFTEQLKLLLLHSICCCSLRIADKPYFKCLIWNHTEINCHFRFHAQAFFQFLLQVFKFWHIHSLCQQDEASTWQSYTNKRPNSAQNISKRCISQNNEIFDW